ncbi:acyltransferase [Selenomonas sp. oral taxon 126]|uniref:acyltransferase n=1 Tax=Selenomonas sp. oral taxon 126 TaxID=712528 RepID=UPI001C12CC03|nr:hypothetical protein [Selenomonas sp. oral taxon 126]
MLIFLSLLVFLLLNLVIALIASRTAKSRYLSRKESINTLTVVDQARQSVGIMSVIADYVESLIRYQLRLLGNVPSHRVRNLILTHIYGMKIGKRVVIYGGFEIRSPWNISIDEGTIIGDESKLDGRNEIVIGKNVNFSTGVWIWTEQHDFQSPSFACKGGKVEIGDHAWISTRSIILPGRKIGEGSVVAAGAVLTKNTEPYGVYGGVPAKKIGERIRHLEYSFNGEHYHFF